MIEPGLDRLLAGAGVHPVRAEDEVVARVRAFRPDALVFDLTQLGAAVFDATARLAGVTASLSPIFEHAGRVDLLVTRALPPPDLPGVRVLHGLEYAVLGEPVQPIPDAEFERALARPRLPVAVCMGGADPENRTLAIVRTFARSAPSLDLLVCLGDAYAHDERLLVEAGRPAVVRPGAALWRAAAGCALGVLAGGVVGLEALRAGLPALHLLARSEHVALVEGPSRAGAVLVLGLFSEASLGSLVACAEALERDRSRLRAMRRAGQMLVDDLGAERILGELERAVAQGGSPLLGR